MDTSIRLLSLICDFGIIMKRGWKKQSTTKGARSHLLGFTTGSVRISGEKDRTRTREEAKENEGAKRKATL